jgi:hypothetical protein
MNCEPPIRGTNRPRQKRPRSRLVHGAEKWPRAMATLLAVAGTLAVSAQTAYAQRDEVDEYELKAVILNNISRFVEWPPSAYADSRAPTVLCILGQDPLGDPLTKLRQEPDPNVRPVSIRWLKTESGIRDCHVLYISTSERKSVVQILSGLKGASVLTVGEMSQFAAQGGIIQFTLEDKQVRFEINLDAASRMALKISSRLLVLARVVTDQKRNPDSMREPSAAAPVTMASALVRPSTEREHGVAGKTPVHTPSKTPGS